jgi:hypothetical protein
MTLGGSALGGRSSLAKVHRRHPGRSASKLRADSQFAGCVCVVFDCDRFRLFGKNSQMGGLRSRTADPKTFAMVDGPMPWNRRGWPRTWPHSDVPRGSDGGTVRRPRRSACRYGALRGRANSGRSSANRGAQDGKLKHRLRDFHVPDWFATVVGRWSGGSRLDDWGEAITAPSSTTAYLSMVSVAGGWRRWQPWATLRHKSSCGW